MVSAGVALASVLPKPIRFEKSANRRAKISKVKKTEDDGGEDLVLPPAHTRICKFEFDKLLNWNSIKGPARGLENMGNTCFMNSALQCLASTPSFAQFMSMRTHRAACRVPKEKFCAFCWAENFIGNLMHSSKRNPAAPKILARNIRAIGRQFRLGRQEDAHEFLRCFIDHMTKSALETARVKEGDPGKRDVTTSFNSIFGGYFRNQLKCSRCGYCSNTYEHFLDLSLDVGNGIDTVPKALRNFASVERLDESNMWKCKRCNRPVCAAKQMTVHVLPKVLTIQLKRFSFVPRLKKGMNKFSYGMLMGGGSKLQQPIHFPFTLDVSSILSDVALKENRHVRYDLHGVLVHQGHSASSGHYYSYCKAADGTWYCMNDESVSRSSPEQVARQQAYLLFYSQVPTAKKAASTTPSELSAESPRNLASPTPTPIPVPPPGPPGGEDTAAPATTAEKPGASAEKTTEAGKKRSLEETQAPKAAKLKKTSASPAGASDEHASDTDAPAELPDSVLDLETIQWTWSSKPRDANTGEPLAKQMRLSFSASSEVNPLSDKLFGLPGVPVPEPPKTNPTKDAKDTNSTMNAGTKKREVIPPLCPLSYLPNDEEREYFTRISGASFEKSGTTDSDILTVSHLLKDNSDAEKVFPTADLHRYNSPTKWDVKNVQIAVRKVTPLPPAVHMRFDSDNEDEEVTQLMKQKAEKEERRKREEVEAEKRRIKQVRAKKDMAFPMPPASMRAGAFASGLSLLSKQLGVSDSGSNDSDSSGSGSDTDDSDGSTGASYDSDDSSVSAGNADDETSSSDSESDSDLTDMDVDARPPTTKAGLLKAFHAAQEDSNEERTSKPRRVQLETVEIVKKPSQKKREFDPSVFASSLPSIMESKLASSFEIQGWDDDDSDDSSSAENAQLQQRRSDKADNKDSKSSKQLNKNSQFDEDGFRVRLPDEAVLSDSEWDDILDAGRVKKVRDKDAENKNAVIGKEGGDNAFQRALEKRLQRQASAGGRGYRKGHVEDREPSGNTASDRYGPRGHNFRPRGRGSRGGMGGGRGRHGRGGKSKPILGAGSSAFGKAGLKFGITPQTNLHRKKSK